MLSTIIVKCPSTKLFFLLPSSHFLRLLSASAAATEPYHSPLPNTITTTTTTLNLNVNLRSLVKCGRLHDARQLFDQMPTRDVVSWTTIISDYVASSDAHNALLLFSRARVSDPPVVPDSFLLSVTLKACGLCNPPHLRSHLGRPLHSYSVKCGLNRSVFVASALLDLYSKAGLLDSALQVFDEMPQRNAVSWTAVITALVQAGKASEAILHFIEMRKSRIAWVSHTFAIALKACADIGELSCGRVIHAQAVRLSFDSIPYVANVLSALYNKCGKVRTGLLVFDRMLAPDVVSWTTAIATLAKSVGGEQKSIEMFIRMLREGVDASSARPNEYTIATVVSVISSASLGEQLHALAIGIGVLSSLSVSNAMISMYSRVGKLQSAMSVFNDMKTRDVVSWSAIISCYAQVGLVEDAFHLFMKMRIMGIDVNDYVFSSILTVCAQMAMLHQGMQLHANAIVAGLEADSMVSSSLVNMYAKCGCVEDACMIFDGEKTDNLISWTSMINGYADNGNSNKAIELFEEMREARLKPDAIAFLGVLSACSHAGLVELGLSYFLSMTGMHGIHPQKEHFGCLLDLLCRAGCLEEAEEVIESMPSPFKTDEVLWSILLQACRIQGNTACGKRTADRLLELQSDSAATLISLSNIYAAERNWRDMSDVRVLMRSKSVVKEPGSSWVTVGDQVSVFVSGDRKHLMSSVIYDMLDCLVLGVKMESYVPDLDHYFDWTG